MNAYIVIIIIIIFFFSELYWMSGTRTPFSLFNYACSGAIKVSHVYGINKLNKEACYENLSILHDILNKHNIFFWLSEGTALGFRRGGDFIDHDDDLDVAIHAKDKEKLYSLTDEFNKHGFKCAGSGIHGMPHMLIRNNEKVDIDITGKGLHCASIGDSCDSLMPFVKKFNKINIRGKIYNIPTDDYLVKLYGNDWMTPIKNKKYNK